MQSATQFNTVVTGLLAKLATGQRVALARGARRFASLVSSRHALEAPQPEGAQADGALTRAPATLKIASGLHSGASLELTAAEYLIGCGDDCDLVLRDSHIAARHCSLSRSWSGFTVQDLRSRTPRPVPPREVKYDAGAIEVHYEIGALQFVLRQVSPPRDLTGSAVAHDRSPARTWLLMGMVGVLLVVMAVATAGRAVKASPEAQARRSGELNSRARGQSTERLVEQARQALADDTLQVEFRDGRLLVEGRTTRTALKTRIQALADDLRGTVPVEDHVTYADGTDYGSAGPLPVRVQSVMVGNPSYFITDNGARYFVGGVLPDGAEVMSIDANEIRFTRGGRTAVYKLQ